GVAGGVAATRRVGTARPRTSEPRLKRAARRERKSSDMPIFYRSKLGIRAAAARIDVSMHAIQKADRTPPGTPEIRWTRRRVVPSSRLQERSPVEPLVRLIPLGGLGEIGLNMMLIESGDDLIAVDCGLMFPD